MSAHIRQSVCRVCSKIILPGGGVVEEFGGGGRRHLRCPARAHLPVVANEQRADDHNHVLPSIEAEQQIS